MLDRIVYNYYNTNIKAKYLLSLWIENIRLHVLCRGPLLFASAQRRSHFLCALSGKALQFELSCIQQLFDTCAVKYNEGEYLLIITNIEILSFLFLRDRVTGEEWLVREPGSYLKGIYEEVIHK